MKNSRQEFASPFRPQLPSRVERLERARQMVELGTEKVLAAVSRNEFIGKPVTAEERRLRKMRDRLIRAELGRAKRALTLMERLANA
ncbi:MAG: hypothetical protein Q8L65_13390 [Burkholderiales bacterium]|nr:hypothetical protein [Burkholderiales bacterium]